MGAKTQNVGPHPLVLYWRAGGTHMVKDNGFGWLRWLLKAGGVTLPKHRNNRHALECPFVRHDYSPPTQGSLQHLRRKAEVVAPHCLPVPITFHLKGNGRLTPVAHACNPSYSGGRDQEDHGSKSPRANSSS
jgi:hypothetical protein